jgi:hypothetical protein
MQLSAAFARVNMLASKLFPDFHPSGLGNEIQAKLREYCRLVAPAQTEDPLRAAEVYQARPLSVTASRIAGFGSHDANGGRAVTLEDGRAICATRNDLVRINLQVGDYYVCQNDGAAEFVSAQEFESRYSPVPAEAA